MSSFERVQQKAVQDRTDNLLNQNNKVNQRMQQEAKQAQNAKQEQMRAAQRQAKVDEAVLLEQAGISQTTTVGGNTEKQLNQHADALLAQQQKVAKSQIPASQHSITQTNASADLLDYESAMGIDKQTLNQELKQDLKKAAQKSEINMAEAISQDNQDLMGEMVDAAKNVRAASNDASQAQKAYRLNERATHGVSAEERIALRKMKVRQKFLNQHLQAYEGVQDGRLKTAYINETKAEIAKNQQWIDRANAVRTEGIKKDAQWRINNAESRFANIAKKAEAADGKVIQGLNRQAASGERALQRLEKIGSKGASGLGFKTKAGLAALGALALSGVAYSMFAGGKKENAELYNPNAAFQYD